MKKVLTVFLSIALVLAMIPGTVFAWTEVNAEQLCCFYTYDVTVGENGYLSVKSGGTLEPITEPEVEINCTSTFYFATKDEAGYKAVKWGSSGSCPITWQSDKVTCQKGGDDYEYEVKISGLGENYIATYTAAEDSKIYALAMKCGLPHEGCYSSETASQETYLDHFQYSTENNVFYIISKSDSSINDIKYVKDYDSNKESISGVTITDTDKKSVKKVIVDGSVFNDETKKLEGDIALTYDNSGEAGGTHTNSFWFEIYGPDYKPADDENTDSDISFYSDENCTAEIDDFSVNTSLAPSENSFYIKSTVGEPAINEITTYYTEWDSNAKKMISYTGRFDCTDANVAETYVETDEYGKAKEEAYLPKTDVNNKTGTKPSDFVKIESVTGKKDTYKLSFKAATAGDNTYDYRGKERMEFEIKAADDNGYCYNSIGIDYGVNVLYDESGLDKIVSADSYRDEILGMSRTDSVIEKIADGKLYRSELFNQSSNIVDRCGEELILAIDTAKGYVIKSIKNNITEEDLPYTVQAEYYYRVYDGNKEIIADDELLEENSDFDLGYVSSEDENDSKYAFWALQRVGKNSAYTGDFFKIGVENVTALKDFCKAKNYRAELIGYALSYTIFIPVDEQCEVAIETGGSKQRK